MDRPQSLPNSSRPPAAASPTALGPSERWLSRVVLALILLAVAIRVPLIVNAPPGMDEVSHLHSTWAVAHGQVPYKDFWQMHPPLLYYLMAPVFAIMGEDLRIIYVARGIMLLCIILILLQLYRIARACFDPLTGLLAACLLSYLLLWWRSSYEIRADLPQTLLILVGLWRFMQAWERRSRSDFLAAGALLGVASWLLIKTLFPLLGLTLVFVLSTGLRRSRAALRENLTNLFLFLGAFAILVVFGAVLLWMIGALPNFIQWALINNFRFPDRVSALGQMRLEVHFVFLALAAAGMVLAVIRMLKAKVVDEFQLAPLLAATVTAVVYLFLMPAPYAQSALPFLPLAAMYGADVLRNLMAIALSPGSSKPAVPGDPAVPFVWSPSRLASGSLAALLLCGACVLPLRALLDKMPPLQDQWPNRRQTIRYVLALASPGDGVFDAYGLSIFRPHCTYYYRLSEGILMWLRSGFIPEVDLMNDLRRSHCKVVMLSKHLRRLPPNLLRFVESHYVPTGVGPGDDDVLVAGQVLRRADLKGTRATVSLIATATYEVRPVGGMPRILIDDRSYQGPLFLEQGDHEVVVEGDFESLAIVYSRVFAPQLRWLYRSASDQRGRSVAPPSQEDDR
jgi:4-amino-4-deoxy-L-arabinose transferase-like glycosyltransferase